MAASINAVVTAPSGYKKVTLSSAIVDEERMLGYALTQLGHILEGAVLYYDTSSNPSFEILSNLTTSALSNAFSFDVWLRPSQGATSGRMFYFRVNITELNAAVSGPSLDLSIWYQQNSPPYFDGLSPLTAR